jgi:uncharacterized membrane protein (UPF0127 family)
MVATAILVLAVLGLATGLAIRDRLRERDYRETVISTGTFTLRAPLTQDGIERGLMGIQKLQPHTGMAFDLGRPQQAFFWMKGCLTPMDMVFLGDHGEVQGVVTAAVPPEGEDGPFYTALGARSSRWFGPALPPTRFVVEVPVGEGPEFARTEAREVPTRFAAMRYFCSISGSSICPSSRRAP